MNNTGEQVADDNRKKDYTSAGSATHSLLLPVAASPHPDKTAQTIPIIHAHVIEITSMKIYTLHTCSTEARKDSRKNSKSPSLPPSESSFHRSRFLL